MLTDKINWFNMPHHDQDALCETILEVLSLEAAVYGNNTRYPNTLGSIILSYSPGYSHIEQVKQCNLAMRSYLGSYTTRTSPEHRGQNVQNSMLTFLNFREFEDLNFRTVHSESKHWPFLKSFKKSPFILHWAGDRSRDRTFFEYFFNTSGGIDLRTRIFWNNVCEKLKINKLQSSGDEHCRGTHVIYDSKNCTIDPNMPCG
jgi:hypothetical protein